jgi:nitroreductase
LTRSLEKTHFAVRPSKEPREAHDFAELLGRRFSCRGFLATPVPRETITAVLSIAQLTASWCNSQAWQVHITSGEATRRFADALMATATGATGASIETDFPRPARYAGIYLDRRRETGWQLYEAVGVAHGDREGSARQTLENFRLFGAPHAAVITSDRDLGVYGAVDCGGYIANFMTAAQCFGIDTIAQAAIAMQSDTVRQFFSIPQDRMVVCGISFGYRDEAHPANSFRTRRDDIDEIVHWVDQ